MKRESLGSDWENYQAGDDFVSKVIENALILEQCGCEHAKNAISRYY